MRTTYSRWIVAVALLSASALVTVDAQTKYGVTVQTVSPDKLAKVATYQWSGGSLNRRVDGQITAAVERELAARGITKVTSGRSDVVVSFTALGRTDADMKAEPKTDGTVHSSRASAPSSWICATRSLVSRSSAPGSTRRSKETRPRSRRRSTRRWRRSSRSTRARRSADAGVTRPSGDPMSNDDSTNAPERFLMSPPLPSPNDSPPPSPEVEVTFGARSRRGPLRFQNDDHYMVLRLGRYQDTLLTSLSADDVPRRFDESGYGMVVADGLGCAGETASRLAISTLVHLGLSFGKWHLRIDVPIAEEVKDRADRFYRAVDATLLAAGQDSSRALQTTLTAVYTAGNDMFFAHVGHSRAYLFRQAQLIQLTRDHAREPEPRRPRTIAAVGDGVRDVLQVVTETLGREGAGIPRIDIERCSLLDGDVILLCTNGLTDVVDDARIAMVLELHAMPDDQCHALVDLAAESGGQDDVTVIAGHYRVPPE